jgi:hypothetical protein
MPGAFIESDISEMFVEADFATASVYGAATINVIFDAEFLETDVGGGVSVDGSSPVAYAQTNTMANIARGDTITIGGVAYVVTDRQDDNTGVTMLRLRT